MRIPEGTEYFIKDFNKITYCKAIEAFGMRMLQYWNVYENRWDMCGYNPWSEIQSISDLTKEGI